MNDKESLHVGKKFTILSFLEQTSILYQNQKLISKLSNVEIVFAKFHNAFTFM